MRRSFLPVSVRWVGRASRSAQCLVVLVLLQLLVALALYLSMGSSSGPSKLIQGASALLSASPIHVWPNISAPFDVVVAWINMSEAGYFYPKRADDQTIGKRPYAGIGWDRDPFSEIALTLRSLHKNARGQIRHIYILYDDELQGPPQFVDWNTPQPVLRLLTHRQVFGARHPGLHHVHVTLAYLHQVAELSEDFLLMPDDVMLVRGDKTLLEMHFNYKWQQFFPGSFGCRINPAGARRTYGPPEIVASHTAIAKEYGKDAQCMIAQHFPMFISKSVLRHLEERFASTVYQCRPITEGVCYYNYNFYCFYGSAVLSLGRATRATNGCQLGVEIHTSCRGTQAIMKRAHSFQCGPMWLNLQGDGVADEYVLCPKQRVEVDNFYFSEFPDAPEWEVYQWYNGTRSPPGVQ